MYARMKAIAFPPVLTQSIIISATKIFSWQTSIQRQSCHISPTERNAYKLTIQMNPFSLISAVLNADSSHQGTVYQLLHSPGIYLPTNDESTHVLT